MRIRPLTAQDSASALRLYDELTLGPKGAGKTQFLAVLGHPGTTVFGALLGDTLAGMCTLHLLPNVTWGGRPYGLIENVITTATQRKQGVGRAVLQAAIDHAWDKDAYKVMLLTGQKRGTKGFYEALGFSEEDKHGMIIRRNC